MASTLGLALHNLERPSWFEKCFSQGMFGDHLKTTISYSYLIFYSIMLCPARGLAAVIELSGAERCTGRELVHKFLQNPETVNHCKPQLSDCGQVFVLAESQQASCKNPKLSQTHKLGTLLVHPPPTSQQEPWPACPRVSEERR